MVRHATLSLALLSLAACQPGEGTAETTADVAPSSSADRETEAYHGIGARETVHFTGTEPFWGGQVNGTSLTYTTPEHPDGIAVPVERFAGRGGLSFGGALAGAPFEMTVSALECADGMSDRTYPFTVTLRIGADLRNGCGWTERQPFAGPAQP
jgi:uncharacterized membrane protein